MDHAAALGLAYWVKRFDELRTDMIMGWDIKTTAPYVAPRVGAEGDTPSSKTAWWKLALVAGAVGVGYLALIRPSIKTGERRLAEARKLASDVGLKYGMTEEEKDRAFDAYHKRKGYPSYLLSTAPKFTT